LDVRHYVSLSKISAFFLLMASAEVGIRGSPEGEALRAPPHWRSDSVLAQPIG